MHTNASSAQATVDTPQLSLLCTCATSTTPLRAVHDLRPLPPRAPAFTITKRSVADRADLLFR